MALPFAPAVTGPLAAGNSEHILSWCLNLFRLGLSKNTAPPKSSPSEDTWRFPGSDWRQQGGGLPCGSTASGRKNVGGVHQLQSSIKIVQTYCIPKIQFGSLKHIKTPIIFDG
jgi:hypothetical protein